MSLHALRWCCCMLYAVACCMLWLMLNYHSCMLLCAESVMLLLQPLCCPCFMLLLYALCCYCCMLPLHALFCGCMLYTACFMLSHALCFAMLLPCFMLVLCFRMLEAYAATFLIFAIVKSMQATIDEQQLNIWVSMICWLICLICNFRRLRVPCPLHALCCCTP